MVTRDKEDLSLGEISGSREAGARVSTSGLCRLIARLHSRGLSSLHTKKTRLRGRRALPPLPVLGFQVGRPGPFSKKGLMRHRPSYGWSLLLKSHAARTATHLIFSRALCGRAGVIPILEKSQKKR